VLSVLPTHENYLIQISSELGDQAIDKQNAEHKKHSLALVGNPEDI
jgi:hypothetical protein